MFCDCNELSFVACFFFFFFVNDGRLIAFGLTPGKIRSGHRHIFSDLDAFLPKEKMDGIYEHLSVTS